MTPPSLSVTIITLNEEANIRSCLESVKWADEIVVADSGSTDRTCQICGEYGCRVFNHEWEGYAGQKNFALGQATGDWILSLDADEEVTPDLAAEIRTAVEPDADAYFMPRSNQFLGKWMRHGGWYPDQQLRLFRRGSGEFKAVPLHEHIVLSEGALTGRLVNPLLHYTYPTVSDFIEKADRYTTIEAAALIKEGRAPKSLIFSIVLAFPVKFAEVYFYKGGWLDGLHGFVAASLMSMRVLLRHLKIWRALRGEAR